MRLESLRPDGSRCTCPCRLCFQRWLWRTLVLLQGSGSSAGRYSTADGGGDWNSCLADNCRDAHRAHHACSHTSLSDWQPLFHDPFGSRDFCRVDHETANYCRSNVTLHQWVHDVMLWKTTRSTKGILCTCTAAAPNSRDSRGAPTDVLDGKHETISEDYKEAHDWTT